MKPLKLYLFLYNAIQAIGWSLALLRIFTNVISSKSVSGTFAVSGSLISLLQSIGFLEVLHGTLGIVPNGIVLPLMQWGGRTHFLFGIVRELHEVQQLPAVFITFTAWSLTEIIRYSQYAINGVDLCPYWLTYLRYTIFIFLYPIGVFAGEMWLMYESFSYVKEKNLYADAFASLPFSYYDFLKGLFILYPFLWLKLYLHLFKQRTFKLRKMNRKKQT